MNLGVRSKLLLAAVTLAAVVGLVSAAFLQDARAIAIATVASFVAAILMGWWTTALLTRRLGKLVNRARDIARGENHKRLLAAQDEQMLGGVAGSMVRISEELNETVDALARERNRFEAVLEHMSEAVIAVDARRRVTLVNRAAVELLELESEPIDRPIVEVLRAPALQELIEEAAAGRAGSREFDISTTMTKRVLAQSSAQQETVGTVVVMHDVTELRRLETMRRDFVANVSHELRTPVSIIRATAETLHDGALDDPKHAERFLDALIRNSERLSALISDLLDISRVEAGEYPIEAEPLDVQDAAERAISAVSTHAEDRDIDLQADIPPAIYVHAERRALDQVLVNLVGNAVKYNVEGGRVLIRARPVDGRVRIEVEDNGPGIAAQHRDRIFERFYRVDSGRSREVGGTGLGLSIVKHLVAAMDGELGYSPAEPRGSLFWFTLPAA